MQRRLSPRDIRYTQDSISHRFQNGNLLDDVISALRKGLLHHTDLPPIRVVCDADGLWWSLDNRRLFVFRSLEEEGYLSTVYVNDVSSSNKQTLEPYWGRLFDEGMSVRVRRGGSCSDQREPGFPPRLEVKRPRLSDNIPPSLPLELKRLGLPNISPSLSLELERLGLPDIPPKLPPKLKRPRLPNIPPSPRLKIKRPRLSITTNNSIPLNFDSIVPEMDEVSEPLHRGLIRTVDRSPPQRDTHVAGLPLQITVRGRGISEGDRNSESLSSSESGYDSQGRESRCYNRRRDGRSEDRGWGPRRRDSERDTMDSERDTRESERDTRESERDTRESERDTSWSSNEPERSGYRDDIHPSQQGSRAEREWSDSYRRQNSDRRSPGLRRSVSPRLREYAMRGSAGENRRSGSPLPRPRDYVQRSSADVSRYDSQRDSRYESQRDSRYDSQRDSRYESRRDRRHEERETRYNEREERYEDRGDRVREREDLSDLEDRYHRYLIREREKRYEAERLIEKMKRFSEIDETCRYSNRTPLRPGYETPLKIGTRHETVCSTPIKNFRSMGSALDRTESALDIDRPRSADGRPRVRYEKENSAGSSREDRYRDQGSPVARRFMISPNMRIEVTGDLIRAPSRPRSCPEPSDTSDQCSQPEEATTSQNAKKRTSLQYGNDAFYHSNFISLEHRGSDTSSTDGTDSPIPYGHSLTTTGSECDSAAEKIPNEVPEVADVSSGDVDLDSLDQYVLLDTLDSEMVERKNPKDPTEQDTAKQDFEKDYSGSIPGESMVIETPSTGGAEIGTEDKEGDATTEEKAEDAGAEEEDVPPMGGCDVSVERGSTGGAEADTEDKEDDATTDKKGEDAGAKGKAVPLMDSSCDLRVGRGSTEGAKEDFFVDRSGIPEPDPDLSSPPPAIVTPELGLDSDPSPSATVTPKPGPNPDLTLPPLARSGSSSTSEDDSLADCNDHNVFPAGPVLAPSQGPSSQAERSPSLFTSIISKIRKIF